VVKIFADHCIHIDLIEALRVAGSEVIRALEVSLASAPDEKIFAYAQRNRLVLLTFDKDFGDIRHFAVDESYGVVIVEVERMSKDLIIKRVVDFFKKATAKDLQGGLFIIEPARTRVHFKGQVSKLKPR
jgi:predicted nuclease of predicted toxin-antitoxin system